MADIISNLSVKSSDFVTPVVQPCNSFTFSKTSMVIAIVSITVVLLIAGFLIAGIVKVDIGQNTAATLFKVFLGGAVTIFAGVVTLNNLRLIVNGCGYQTV